MTVKIRNGKKYCRSCWIEKPLEEFPLSKRNKNGHGSYCNECRNKWRAEYYRKNPGAVKRAVNKWESKNRNKRIVYIRVRTSIKSGKLIKSSYCDICHKESNKLEAHHWHGYDKKHELDVQWICRKCHRKLSIKM